MTGMDDIAVVTGGARGIGLEVVRQLVAVGMTVVLTARDPERGARTADEVGARFQPVDVTDPGTVATLADGLARTYGRVDVLINNAAAFADWSEAPTTADLDAVTRVLDVNLIAPWRLTQALLPLLRVRSF